MGYKTYVHYFYGRIDPSQKPKIDDWNNPQLKQEWHQYLMFGDIDRPVYFSTKIHRTYRFEEVENLDSLYAKNGFVFYRRNPAPGY